MAGSKRIIIGLGNPGLEYEGTRHNVGFAVLDLLAMYARGTFGLDGRAGSLVANVRLRGRPVILAKPQLFVNRSGKPVKHLLGRLGLEHKEMIVISDDIHLEPGRVRLRSKGGAAGHNGMQDIVDHLGTADFPRLRIGIGRDFHEGYQTDYVLSPFLQEEKDIMQKAMEKARDAVITFVTDGIVQAMNRYNRAGAQNNR